MALGFLRRGLGPVARDYGPVVVGTGLTRLVTFAATVLLARRLGVEAFGLFSLAYTVMILAGQLPAVLDVALVQRYSRASGDVERANLVRAQISLKMLLVCLACGGAGLWVTLVVDRGSPSATWAYAIAFALFAGTAFGLFTGGMAYLQARRRYASYALLYLGQALAVLGGVWAYTCWGRPTAPGSVVVFLVVYAVSAAGVIVYLRRESRAVDKTRIGAAQKSLLSFGGWLIPASLCWVMLQRFDLLWLGGQVGAEELGLYGAAVRMVGMFALLTGTLPVVFLPKASAAMGPDGKLGPFATQAAVAVAGIAIAISAGYAAAGWLLAAVMGPGYEAAAGIMRVLLLGHLAIALASPLTDLIYGAGATRLVFFLRLAQLVVVVGGTIALVPRYGALGAAGAVAVGHGLGLVLVLAFLLRGGLLRRAGAPRRPEG